MAKSGTKVFIKVESEQEQQVSDVLSSIEQLSQQNLAKCKKNLKFLENSADKENITRSPFCPVAKNVFTKSKSAADLEKVITKSENLKRKKVDTRTTATQTEAYKLSPEKREITVKDLTSDESPSEYYWEILAEKRREALGDTLEENKLLYDRIEALEAELDTSKKMLDEAKNLVEVLTEMLEENENENKESTEGINEGASTSAGDSCFFEATNMKSNSECPDIDTDED